MNIKNTLRKVLLNEVKSHKETYGCLMVYLESEDWTNLLSKIKKEDLYQPEEDKTYGKETEPHVTVLYGFHSDIKDSDIEKDINKIKKPNVKLTNISCFNNELYDVLKFDVDSDDMNKLNKEFTKYPHTTSFPDYHPHCTIAYLKKGMGDEYIEKLKKEKIAVEPTKLVYSKANKEKKDYNFKNN